MRNQKARKPEAAPKKKQQYLSVPKGYTLVPHEMTTDLPGMWGRAHQLRENMEPMRAPSLFTEMFANHCRAFAEEKGEIMEVFPEDLQMFEDTMQLLLQIEASR